MNIIEIILVGIGLSMDAFAVSICKGLTFKKINWKQVFKIALSFGFFQAIMPIIGYFLGISFKNTITIASHWIAFVVLTLIGTNMIKESLNGKDTIKNYNLSITDLILLSVATSIDALAVGIAFAFFQSNIIISSIIIGIITFNICAVGVIIGIKFGNQFQSSASIIGGLILIIIGIKIMFEYFRIIKH